MPRFGEELESDLLDMDDVFPFGKYKDLLVADVVEEDPDYIKYIIQQTAHDFTDEVKDAL